MGAGWATWAAAVGLLGRLAQQRQACVWTCAVNTWLLAALRREDLRERAVLVVVVWAKTVGKNKSFQ